MTPADRLRDYAARVAVAMGLDPSRVAVTVEAVTEMRHAAWHASAHCGGRCTGVWVAREGFGVTVVARGLTDEAAVDQACAALSARLLARSREAVDAARRAADVAEWWRRVAATGGPRG